MSDDPSEQTRQDVPTDERKKTPTITRIIVAAVVLFVLLALIDWFYVNEHSERIRFITVNSLSLLVVVIIAIQSVIYRREWRVMQQGLHQTDRMIEKMQLQLEAINRQEGHLLTQAEAAKTQAETMQGQLEAMNNSLAETRTLVAQNERAVKAAEDNVATVEKTAIYANRAYVMAKIRGTSEDSTRLQFRLRIENSGNTPANNVRVEYAHGLRDNPPHHETEEKAPGFSKERFVVFDNGFTESERLGLIAPNSSYHVIETPKSGPFTGAQFQDWKLGKLNFYCWGRVYYETIFDETRHTEFCFVQSQKRPGGYPCGHGNSAI